VVDLKNHSVANSEINSIRELYMDAQTELRLAVPQARTAEVRALILDHDRILESFLNSDRQIQSQDLRVCGGLRRRENRISDPVYSSDWIVQHFEVVGDCPVARDGMPDGGVTVSDEAGE